ncbi:MAG: class I adenylate-forming enzyme family protein, partial [Gammaproteobacteria bacterium]
GIAALLKPRAFLSIPEFRGAPHCAVQAAAFPSTVRCLPFSCADPETSQAVPVAVDADEVFTICWTSGTTGTPKGVPRSHNQWLAQTVAVNGMGVLPGMRMLCPFPLVNMASLSGFFFPWLQCRGTLALHHPLELPVFLGQLHAERIEYTVVPPALLNMLLKQPALLAAHDLPALRIVASGSAPLAPWMVRGFQEEHGIEVVNVFGSNEGVSLLSSVLDVPEPEQRAALFPRFGVEGIHWRNPVSARIRTRLVDPQSGEVANAPGQTGELQVQGPNVFDGYFAAPEDNRRAFSEDGFFRSGDLFEIATEDPRFYRFVGRCKDIIVRGGMKISPEELDTLLAGHPMLAEVAVAPYPDEVLGERICAVVVPRPGQTPVLADVVSWLEAQGIARIKLPEKLLVLEALPRNPLGKLLRHELAALLRG